MSAETREPVERWQAHDGASLAEAALAWGRIAFDDDAPRVLEVRLAPGRYERLCVRIGDPLGPTDVAIRVIGGPGVVFDGASLHLAGSDLHVEGLLFTGRRSATALCLSPTRTVRVDRVAFVEARIGERATFGSTERSCAIDLQALATRAQASISRCWFVSVQQAAGALVELHEQAERTWKQAALEQIALYDCGPTPLLGLHAQTDVELSGSALHLGPGVPLAASTRPRASLHVTHCDLLVDAVDRLLHGHPASDRLTLEFLPPRVAHSLVRTRAEESLADPGTRLDPATRVLSDLPPDPRDWPERARALQDPPARLAGEQDARE